jgi:hypothetical protein
VLPNGDLINVFDFFLLAKNSHKLRGANIALIRSSDKGDAWSKRATIVAQDRAIGAFNPDTGRPIRAEGGIPQVAVDRTSGNLYIVWQDSRFRGVDEVAFSMSADGGRTWSAPIKVNQTPQSSIAGNQQAFVPSVRVAEDGTVAVTYYDFRNNDANPGTPTDYWIVHCHTSCTNAASWQDENRLTASSFDMEQAPAARGPFGFFVGDYEGLANVGNSFLPVFVTVNNGNPANRTDVFGRFVTP